MFFTTQNQFPTLVSQNVVLRKHAEWTHLRVTSWLSAVRGHVEIALRTKCSSKLPVSGVEINIFCVVKTTPIYILYIPRLLWIIVLEWHFPPDSRPFSLYCNKIYQSPGFSVFITWFVLSGTTPFFNHQFNLESHVPILHWQLKSTGSPTQGV